MLDRDMPGVGDSMCAGIAVRDDSGVDLDEITARLDGVANRCALLAEAAGLDGDRREPASALHC